MPPGQHEILRISKGALGPLKEGTEINVRPLTVLVGKQGTGKSLAAQVLYFFRDLPFLVNYDAAIHRRDLSVNQDFGPESVVRSILDGLRSSQRSFAAFANPSATLEWTGLFLGSERTLKVSLYENRRTRPQEDLKQAIDEIRQRESKPQRAAVFIPTERLIYSQGSDASFRVLSLPLTLTIFSLWMDEALRVFESWPDNVPDTHEGRWIRERGHRALAGEAYRHLGQWKWRADIASGGTTQFDIDMASSGQRANWPLVFLPQALFSMRSNLAETVTLYVEEPEIHLHPSAQLAMMEILAFLVNCGFRVVVTTHSLTILYALNNFCMAGAKLAGEPAEGTPSPAVRLRSGMVAAYVLDQTGARSIVDEKTGFIAEDELGRVSDELMAQMNRIALAAETRTG